MANSHILSQEFEYLEPRTVEEALSLLVSHRNKTRVMAGGTDLLVQMKMGKVDPECVINLGRIPALRYLIVDKGLRIGTLTSFWQIEKHAVVREKYTALFEAASAVTSVQIKHMGTLGGNLCNASPAADSAPPLLVFAAKVRLVTEDNGRVLPLEDFFLGPGQTVLSPRELLLEIQLPEVLPRTGSAFLKMGRVSADLAKVSVAVKVVREGEVCKDCRIAFGSVAKTPLRTPEAEKILRGKTFDKKRLEEVSRRSSEEIQPISDIRSTAWYRKEICRVLVRDAMNTAWDRASGS
jgi:CO/xanthine dehydrogenase FAD-binding subunit